MIKHNADITSELNKTTNTFFHQIKTYVKFSKLHRPNVRYTHNWTELRMIANVIFLKI